ncbi:HNH endonuclease [Streptomyces sp. AP-93]|uniref:HNH endonuclease n=1 Tax=Streptomyces sp. AP-93 TaxID=2929048 RepID=UPI001FAF24FC|nr:HNH endonuclease signature motif containing protein [Streptomyces sp. AP-93]MCJ0872224.1 HNH endonuclease [Streptomyces sp. AP-93]
MSIGNRYTQEVLAEAAAVCADIDEVIAHLGTRPYSQLGRYLMRCFRKYGIDTTHFKSRRRSYEWRTKPDSATLREAVASSHSLAGTLRCLGRTPSGSLNEALKVWIREDGLSTAHFLGQAHQRGKPGRVTRRTAEEVLVKHEGTQRTRTLVLRRALREVGVPECCSMCGTTPDWLGRPMTLEIDHISGDWRDDRQENLRLLCPNCHAVTDTWCRGGRRSRKSRVRQPHA